eukprot:GHRQ01001025.1.p1 GENE.GHRQ01001025.1~~GHRQ01001025.1.p1  ORF type:complete len:329 (+),score=104.63 GHRQ01001025.1:182-1168(+)
MATFAQPVLKSTQLAGRLCRAGRSRARQTTVQATMLRSHPELEESYAKSAPVTALQVPQVASGRPLPSSSAFPPIISSAARSADDVASEVAAQLEQHPQALVSGVEPDMYASLRKLVPGVQYHGRAKMLIIKPQDSPAPKQQRLPGSVCVISAGPEDQAAADQVKVAAEHMGCYVMSKQNLSTRNMPQLMEQLQALQAADVVVVIAGLDSGLPGVVCGLVDAPVIAVPTSNGASNGLQGLGNLVAAVSSCAPGVSVVNIDGTVSAAVMATRMLRMAAARVEMLTAAAAAATPASMPSGSGTHWGAVANNVVPAFDTLTLPGAQAAAVL